MTSPVYFDSYNLRARIAPVIVVSLPGVLAALVWIPEFESTWERVLGVVGAGALSILISQLGRDRGKRKQDELFRKWGGMPTTRHLRHQESSNRESTKRRHNKLQKLMAGLVIPSASEEQTNPQAADEIYEACTNFLRANTRDKKRFPLVYEENCNYGFRRNLWGLKPYGVSITIISLIAIASYITVSSLYNCFLTPILMVSSIIDVLILAIWIFVITPEWVRVPAEEYAKQLLDALEQM